MTHSEPLLHFLNVSSAFIYRWSQPHRTRPVSCGVIINVSLQRRLFRAYWFYWFFSIPIIWIKRHAGRQSNYLHLWDHPSPMYFFIDIKDITLNRLYKIAFLVLYSIWNPRNLCAFIYVNVRYSVNESGKVTECLIKSELFHFKHFNYCVTFMMIIIALCWTIVQHSAIIIIVVNVCKYICWCIPCLFRHQVKCHYVRGQINIIIYDDNYIAYESFLALFLIPLQSAACLHIGLHNLMV